MPPKRKRQKTQNNKSAPAAAATSSASCGPVLQSESTVAAVAQTQETASLPEDLEAPPAKKIASLFSTASDATLGPEADLASVPASSNQDALSPEAPEASASATSPAPSAVTGQIVASSSSSTAESENSSADKEAQPTSATTQSTSSAPSTLAEQLDPSVAVQDTITSSVESTSSKKVSFTASPPEQIAPDPAQTPPRKFVMTDVFENIHNFETHIQGGDGTYFNIKWWTYLKRRRNLFFYCIKPVLPIPGEQGWKIKIEYNVKVCTIDGTIAFDSHGRSNIDQEHCKCSGSSQFPIEAFRDEDTLIAEMEVTILSMEGIEMLGNSDEEKQENQSNQVLIVEDEKFHVSKEFLCSQSPVLKEILTGKNHQEEVQLPGIRADEFRNLLNVLYHKLAFYKGTIEGILRLADMYKIKNLFWKCEEFLLKDSRYLWKLKIKLAWTYNLRRLKKHSIAQLKSKAEVRAIMEEDVHKMDSSLVAALLGRMLSFPS